MSAAAGAAVGMFIVGTLAAISDVIADYPVYGGQAVRYAAASVILLIVARLRGLGPVRPARRGGGAEPGRSAAPGAAPGQGDEGASSAATGRSRGLEPGLSTGRRRGVAARGAPVRLRLRQWALMASLSLTGLVAFNICVIEATRASGPVLAGIVLGTVPLVMAVLGPLTSPARGGRRSRPSPRVLAAAATVVAGTTLATGLGSGGTAGLLWSLGALACEICFSLLALPLLPALGPIRLSAWSAALAVPFLLAAGFAVDGVGMLRVPTAAEAMGLAYLTVVVTTIAFLLWYRSLPRLGADRAGLFAGMIPVGAMVTTAALGLGPVTPADIAGGAVVIAGILLGLRTPPSLTGSASGSPLPAPDAAR